MCTVVRVITDDDEVDCETLGDLAEALGISDFASISKQPDAEHNDCLCWTDFCGPGVRKISNAHYSYVIDRRSNDQG